MSFRGPNYYSRRPLIKLIFEPGEHGDREYNAIRAWFPKDIPSLVEHRCNSGIRGGFLSEIDGGTSLGHIIEHLAIEFQYLIGHDVSFGRTIPLGDNVLRDVGPGGMVVIVLD